MSSAARLPEVLTLDEVASYLRLSREVVEREVAGGRLPGRRIYEEWRFLKAAIDDWLRVSDSRIAMLRRSGLS